MRRSATLLHGSPVGPLRVMVRRALLTAAALFLTGGGAASAVLLHRQDGTPTVTTATTTTVAATTTTAPPATTTTETETLPATTTTEPPPTTTAPTTTTAPAAPLPAPGKPAVAFVVSGHGWGHGVGMSQWGAKGYADRGWTYDKILAHYYVGTTLGPAPAAQIRVLLSAGAKSLALASATPWSVVDGDGASHALPAGRLSLGPGLRLPSAGAASVETLVPPLRFQAQGGPLQLGARTYRGAFEVTKTKAGRLQLVNVVGLDDYVKGVVAAEMPSYWPAEALKAQAVAARSYALANRQPGKAFDVYADTRSQVYGGIGAEAPAASAAVDATAGQVVLYKGQVADTLFSSSSGGRTAAATDVFATPKPVPYLVSVPDPYDLSPYRNWGPVVVDGAKAAKALGVTPPLEDIATTTASSGRVKTAVVTSPTGALVSTGSALRDALGLRSTWFTIGLLSLTAPPSAIAYGSTATIPGVARGVPAPVVEQRAGSVFWTPGPTVVPGPGGAFSFTVRPLRTTYFRLGTGNIRAATIRVLVAPAVALAAAGGTVRPAVAGTSVDIQAQQGTAWQTVATVPVDAAGGFAPPPLAAGTYRARYAPGNGLVAGVSAPLQVGP